VIENLERAVSAGFRPGAVALTADGQEVVVFSYPFTDGTLICVLGRTNRSDPTSWKEFGINELVLHGDNRTPVVTDE